MNNKFDAPRTEEMQQFLELMYQNALSSETILDWHVVYKELKRYGLGKENLKEDGSLVDIRENFRYWVERVDNHNHNIRAFVSQRHAYWAQFMRNPGEVPEIPFIKLYIPMCFINTQLINDNLFYFCFNF